jgi:two-component system CheB/CheR fusion protein
MTSAPRCQGPDGAAASRPCSPDTAHLRDQLLATVSHELRQPLSLIQMHAELLTRLPVAIEYPAIARTGDMIKQAVRSQARIIDDLLDLSRARMGKLVLERTPVDIESVLNLLVAAFSSEASGRLPFIDLAVSATAICYGDRTRIEQILGNLLRNAIRFTPNHGRIHLAVRREGAFCKVSVADSGCGISAEFLPHVFGMFNQEASPSGRPDCGLGIGLALVQELTLAHGGRVQACSDGPGQGAEFNLWLPAHDESTKTSPTHAVRDAIVRGSNGKAIS